MPTITRRPPAKPASRLRRSTVQIDAAVEEILV